MFKINDDQSIYLTRGDVVTIILSAYHGDEPYLFQDGDIVRFRVFDKKGCDCVAFHRDFVCEAGADSVKIVLTEEETKIGGLISKPKDYWYEIELNPDTMPQTIIGYDDETGAKVFRLFPEGGDKS